MLEAGEERRDGLAGLEVDGAFLDLDDDVGEELAVEGVEDVVGGAGAVGFGVVPVEVVVVDEGAVEDDAVVGGEGGGEGVGGVGGGAAEAGGAGLAFGVGLDGEAGEVGDEAVDLVDLGGPPGFDGGVEGIVGGEAADGLRAGDGDRHGEMDAPGAEGVGDAGDLLEVVGVEELRGGVDVVDVAAVDADGRQQAAVFGDGGEVVADVAAFEEDAAAGVAALDGAVGVVPLVDPADGVGWLVAVGFLVGFRAGGELAEVGEGAVEDAGGAAARDDGFLGATGEEETVGREVVRDVEGWVGVTDFLGRAEEDFAGLGCVRFGLGRRVAIQFGDGGLFERVVAQGADFAGGTGLIAEPGLVGGLSLRGDRGCEDERG